jgi:DNA-directed RNA polymerase beta' subunit
MSYDRTQAIKIFKDVFKNGRITNQLQKQMENDLEQREKSIRPFQDKLNTEPVQNELKNYPFAALYTEVMKIVAEITHESIDRLKMVYLMIEALAYNQLEDKEIDLDTQNKQVITEKDREALDWIHKYMEHEKNENSGQ